MNHARKMKLGTATLIFLLTVTAETRATQLVNRGFDQGNLNGWDYLGDVSAQSADLGVSPSQGQYAALLASVTDPPGSYATSSGTGNLLEWLGLSDLGLQALRAWSNDHQALAPCY